MWPKYSTWHWKNGICWYSTSPRRPLRLLMFRQRRQFGCLQCWKRWSGHPAFHMNLFKIRTSACRTKYCAFVNKNWIHKHWKVPTWQTNAICVDFLEYIYLPVPGIRFGSYELLGFTKCIDTLIHAWRTICIITGHRVSCPLSDAEVKLTIFLWYKEY